MTNPNDKRPSLPNDNIVRFDRERREIVTFDASAFDEIIEQNLNREQSGDEPLIDHPICHIF